VIYQVYPRSFHDTSGTGSGDLKGITQNLDHIASLGVDALWLSPVYVSPLCDGGYDVADHCDIDPLFGTLTDFDALVARAHDLGLRVMMDQVFNHTSDTHDWYAASCAREDPFTDFYVWADPAPDGGPPSNWIGFFGLSAWRWVPARRQYCLHQFLPCQPCLNHYCDALRDRLQGIITFWRDRGVDGFRFDAVTAFFHDKQFRDNPPDDRDAVPSNPYSCQKHEYDMMPNDCAAFSADLRDWAGPDRFLLGEINSGDNAIELAGKFARPDRLDATYTADLPESGVSGIVLADILKQNAGQGGLAWWLSSHDQPRHISRAGDGTAHDARMFAGLLLALPGPVLLYQGEEVGQPQADIPLHALHDPFDRMYWPDVPGRDGARAPMAWDINAHNMGFTQGTPWLPTVQPEGGGVAQQDEDEDSVLAFYREAIALRRDLGLADARIEVLEAREHWVYAKVSPEEGAVCHVVVNMQADAQSIPAGVPDTPPLLASSALQSCQIPPRSAVWWFED